MEKLNCNAIATEASADPAQGPGVGQPCTIVLR